MSITRVSVCSLSLQLSNFMTAVKPNTQSSLFWVSHPCHCPSVITIASQALIGWFCISFCRCGETYLIYGLVFTCLNLCVAFLFNTLNSALLLSWGSNYPIRTSGKHPDFWLMRIPVSQKSIHRCRYGLIGFVFVNRFCNSLGCCEEEQDLRHDSLAYVRR